MTRYYYDGQKIVETRLGEQTTYHQQFTHGTQYIDELVMIRVKGKGDLTSTRMPTGTSSA
ncbi:MAG: hypothetical protein JSU86_12985 [Phycisphaerales bacterium]|nr:MAG: hypothetical protein JSU86_12985 [Phycisphaerales bacterium]